MAIFDLDQDELPGVVQYVGYGGGRGLAHTSVLWGLAGYAHFVMDARPSRPPRARTTRGS